ALTKYLEAQTALQRLQKAYPDWNGQVVKFRLNYVAEKIAAVPGSSAAATASIPASAAATNPPAPSPAAALNATFAVRPRPAEPVTVENQLSGLKDQVRQLQADMIVLQAKLKEALSAQPTALDPSQLTEAQEKMKSLQKENDLLKVSVGQEKSRPTADPRLLEQTQTALADASRKVAEQTQKANNLASEKQALQKKLDSLIPGSWNSNALETT